MRLRFDGRSRPDVGVALELQLVDLETCLPAPAAPSILELLSEEPGVQPDLYQSLLRIDTGVHGSIEEVAGELYRVVGRLRATCGEHGLGLISSATHPTAGWRDLHITESAPYEAFIRRLQWVGRRAAVFGLRISVGVPDGEKAIALGNALSCLVPVLLALSASSPYWRGFDTGLASCRARVVENIPNAGLAPNLLNFGEFQSYVKTLRAAESIESISDIWWDVRPNLKTGTIDIQACDMPHTLRECLALAAFAQMLVVWLLKNYEEGEVVPMQDPWIIRENKWRATRFGLDAELVASSEGELVSVRELFEQLRGRVGLEVGRFGLEPWFADLEGIFQVGPGYIRQRRAAVRHGIENVARLLLMELEQDRSLS